MIFAWWMSKSLSGVQCCVLAAFCVTVSQTPAQWAHSYISERKSDTIMAVPISWPQYLYTRAHIYVHIHTCITYTSIQILDLFNAFIYIHKTPLHNKGNTAYTGTKGNRGHRGGDSQCAPIASHVKPAMQSKLQLEHLYNTHAQHSMKACMPTTAHSNNCTGAANKHTHTPTHLCCKTAEVDSWP